LEGLAIRESEVDSNIDNLTHQSQNVQIDLALNTSMQSAQQTTLKSYHNAGQSLKLNHALFSPVYDEYIAKGQLVWDENSVPEIQEQDEHIKNPQTIPHTLPQSNNFKSPHQKFN